MKSWTQRRAKRKAIDQSEIRRRSKRFGPFMEGARAGRIMARVGPIDPDRKLALCPHPAGSQKARDWMNGFDSIQERENEQ